MTTQIYWLIEFFFTLIESICFFIFSGAFFKKNRFSSMPASMVIAVLGLTVVFILINQISLYSLFSPITASMTSTVFLYAVKKDKLYKIMGVSLLYVLVLFVADLISTYFLTFFTTYSIEDIFTNFSTVRLAGLFLGKALLIIICISFNKIKLLKTSNNRIFVFLIPFSIGMMFLSTAIYLMSEQTERTDYISFILYILLLIFIVTIVTLMFLFYHLKTKKAEHEMIQMRDTMLAKSIQEQEESFYQLRESIHNHKHAIIALKSMLETEDYAGIQKYIDSEFTKFEDNSRHLSTGNLTVDTILNNKRSIARKNGIHFTTNISMPEKIVISDLDLANVLGNLLDNAIEALDTQAEKNLHVQISEQKGFLFIKIVNTYSLENRVPASHPKEKKIHGIGIKSVERILQKYQGNLTLTQKNDKFTATVTIPVA